MVCLPHQKRQTLRGSLSMYFELDRVSLGQLETKIVVLDSDNDDVVVLLVRGGIRSLKQLVVAMCVRMLETSEERDAFCCCSSEGRRLWRRTRRHSWAVAVLVVSLC